MKTNLNLYKNNSVTFQAVHLEKTPELVKKMKSMYPEQRKIFQDTFTLLESKLAQKTEDGKYVLDVMPPIRANYIRTGTYKTKVYTDQKNYRVEYHPVFSRENLSLQIGDDNKNTAGFYLNTNESPQNLAKWLFEAFENLKNKIMKKS